MTEAVRWYVVRAQVSGKAKPAQNPLRQGYEVYLPRYLKGRSHARKVDFAAKPLFRRYLFVTTEIVTQRWRSIQSIQGVSHLVCDGDQLAALPNGQLGALKGREDERGFVRMEANSAFAPGAKVRLLAGALMDCVGLFDGMADHDRLAISARHARRKVRMHLDVDLVVAAGARRIAWRGQVAGLCLRCLSGSLRVEPFHPECGSMEVLDQWQF
jgi:transcriptional antiterminator RfaH